MLPEKNCGESARDQAERQSNYLILSSLEQKLPPELFRQILTEIQGSMKLPGRLSWAGQKSESSFAELKMAQGHLNAGFLTSMLQAVTDLQKRSGSKHSQNAKPNNLQTLLKQTNARQHFQKTSLFAKVHPKPGRLTATLRKEVQLAEFFKFKRMKTVFCHADHSTDEVSSIFNVQFDRTGRFVISGADDGILKIWDRDTLTLQASLHGHLDFITDIDISKCNRFIASAGKDAQVIIWDLKMGRVVKRMTSHSSLINRLLFVAPRVPAQQGVPSAQLGGDQPGSFQTVRAFAANSASDGTAFAEDNDGGNPGGPVSSYVKDQFLLTCSDDGTVHLYDFSPLSRVVDGASGAASQQSTAARGGAQPSGGSQPKQPDYYDEMRVRRSGRRSATHGTSAAQNQQAQNGDAADPEVFIFEVELTPDDYRPGTRNKKLDAVACSSAGIVVAGTSTGEIFCWKLNFTDIARRNQADCYKYLGQFKICKNAGVQFAEFSPTNDTLMTGSTDGSVKIWRLDIPTAKSLQQQALKTFSMSDDSRLVVTIDERNGCIKTNSISYFDEDGAENFEYVPVKQPVSGQIGFKPGKEAAVKFSKSQCDAIKWSVRGRFAIASITSQIEDPRNAEAHMAQAEDFKEEVCRIKIWDTVNETFYDDLARPCGHQLKKNSWVLAPHPIFEELLMTGSDGGTLILWNIEKKQIIQRFSQYGVYSIDGYVRDNPLDGKFSCDGKAFIVGNQLGTISLFSCEANVEHQYEATRVQQFFQYDRSRNSNNPFERIENRPQICGYNMIPHESQPARPLIGRFLSDEFTIQQQTQQTATSQSLVAVKPQKIDNQPEEEEKQESVEQRLQRRKAEARAFERKLITAKELGHLEEKYYQHQLSNCLQESYQPNVLEQGNHLDAFVESSIDLAEGGRERIESGYDDQSLVNALSPPPRRSGQSIGQGQQSPASLNMRSRAQASGGHRRSVGQPNDVINGAGGPPGGRQGGRRRLNRRSDRALRDNPVVNGYDESEELVVDGFQVGAGSPQSLYHEESEDEESASDASDLESSPEVVRQRFQVRRTNIHDQQHAIQEYMEEDRANRRTARLNRRNEMREPADSGTASGRRTARGGGTDINIDLDMVDDDLPQRRRGRGRPSNAERERLRQFQQERGHHRQAHDSRHHRRIIDEDDEDDESAEENSDHEGRRQTRTRLRQASGGGSQHVAQSQTHRSRNTGSTQEEQIQTNARGSVRRNARRIIENSSNSRSMMGEDAHMIEERKGSSPSKAEKTHNQVIRESGYFLSDREEASAFNFDMLQNGGVNDLGDSHEKEQKIKKVMSQIEPPGTQPDEDYSLVENVATAAAIIQQSGGGIKKCSFCQKVDKPLVGPFCKYEKGSNKEKLVGQPLFFHLDCIEFNLYSRFSIETKKWVNIGKALDNLVHNEQFSCYRCQTKGATVQCRDCNKAFHGFKCARMYTLQLEDAEGKVFYQCVFCRNTQNWEDRVSELTEKEVERQELEREGLLHEKSYLKKLSTLQKDHLLASHGYEKSQSEALGQSYNPQVNDFVYYFFQGHEYFMTQYSCHHFCGQQQMFARKRFMPWYKHPKLRKREFVRCRVECVEVLFPSQRSLNLIQMYGENSTQVTQTPEIVQRMTLSVIESTSASAVNNSMIKFQVDIFPNQLPDFLIPQAIFTEKYDKYVRALESGALVDRTFKVYLKEPNVVKSMRIVSGNSPLEPTLYPNSLWQNIKCVESNPGRSGYGRVTEMPQHRSTRSRGGTGAAAVSSAPNLDASIEEDECERISFWDIQFGGQDELVNIGKSMHVFIREEKTKLVNTLKDFIEKKREYIEVFLERVPTELAPDYRSIIPAEMFFNLIKDRINNCYYRSQEQLLSDIDLISYNAKIYNGEHHDISLNAKELCEIIRVKLKQTMFTKSDKLMQQQIEQAGKLTGPSRIRAAFMTKEAAAATNRTIAAENTTTQQNAQTMAAGAVEESKDGQHHRQVIQESSQQDGAMGIDADKDKAAGSEALDDGDKVMQEEASPRAQEAEAQQQEHPTNGGEQPQIQLGLMMPSTTTTSNVMVPAAAVATTTSKKTQIQTQDKTDKVEPVVINKKDLLQHKTSSQSQQDQQKATSTAPASMAEKRGNATAPSGIAASQHQGSTTIEEEKKNPATGVVKINIGAPNASTAENHQTHAQQVANTATTTEHQQPAERPNRRAPKAEQGTTVTEKPSTATGSGGGGRTASNNMSRRRNRINANMLTADELEEKTKTDAAASVTQMQEQQQAAIENDQVDSKPPAAGTTMQQQQQTQQQEGGTSAAATEAKNDTTNMRVTRNLRKRQKTGAQNE